MLRAEWLSADESQVLAPPLHQRVGGRLGLAVAGKTSFLFPPTRMDSGRGGEVGEVPQVLADNGLDAGVTRWFMSMYSTRYSSLPGFRLRPSAGRQRCQRRPGSRSRRPGRLQRSGGHPDVLLSGRRQYSAYDSDTSPRRSRRQRLSRSLDVPQRRDQVDEADVAGSVCLVLSERAFRKPTGYR
jgi:hypothetical protein